MYVAEIIVDARLVQYEAERFSLRKNTAVPISPILSRGMAGIVPVRPHDNGSCCDRYVLVGEILDVHVDGYGRGDLR
jgi:hypothetical protein